MGGERQEEDVDVEAEVGRRDVGMIHRDEEAKREADEKVDEGSRIVERWRDGEKGSEEREKEGGKRRKEGRASASKEKKRMITYIHTGFVTSPGSRGMGEDGRWQWERAKGEVLASEIRIWAWTRRSEGGKCQDVRQTPFRVTGFFVEKSGLSRSGWGFVNVMKSRWKVVNVI